MKYLVSILRIKKKKYFFTTCTITLTQTQTKTVNTHSQSTIAMIILNNDRKPSPERVCEAVLSLVLAENLANAAAQDPFYSLVGGRLNHLLLRQVK